MVRGAVRYERRPASIAAVAIVSSSSAAAGEVQGEETRMTQRQRHCRHRLGLDAPRLASRSGARRRQQLAGIGIGIGIGTGDYACGRAVPPPPTPTRSPTPRRRGRRTPAPPAADRQSVLGHGTPSRPPPPPPPPPRAEGGGARSPSPRNFPTSPSGTGTCSIPRRIGPRRWTIDSWRWGRSLWRSSGFGHRTAGARRTGRTAMKKRRRMVSSLLSRRWGDPGRPRCAASGGSATRPTRVVSTAPPSSLKGPAIIPAVAASPSKSNP
mmetsp:Transcript_38557/g.115713  ORF Transcript_38557/g.115713 Transcript_38557/m.115713 type:complete len:267 (-) Transcript_38557:1376-2176(-)